MGASPKGSPKKRTSKKNSTPDKKSPTKKPQDNKNENETPKKNVGNEEDKKTKEPVAEPSTKSLLRSSILIGFTIMVLSGFVYYQHVQSLSSEEIEFSTMPAAVQNWMEKGQFIPIQDGEETKRLFVVNQKEKSETETVLFIPDFHTSSFTFRGVAESFQQSGISFVTFDLPGFGLSDPPSGMLSDVEVLKVFKKIVQLLKLRTFHLVCQGSSSRVCVRFALDLRAKVKSISFSGVDPAGFATFTPPPYYHRAIGHFLLTSLPGFSHYAIEWYRSRASPTFNSDIFNSYRFLQSCRGGRDYFLDAKSYFHVMRKNCGFTCEKEFQVQALSLNLNATTFFVESGELKTQKTIGYTPPTLAASGSFPTEVSPDGFAMHLKKFILQQTPTEEAPPEQIPAHIQQQLDAGMGHSHDHGHNHDHGHGHDHEF